MTSLLIVRNTDLSAFEAIMLVKIIFSVFYMYLFLKLQEMKAWIKVGRRCVDWKLMSPWRLLSFSCLCYMHGVWTQTLIEFVRENLVYFVQWFLSHLEFYLREVSKYTYYFIVFPLSQISSYTLYNSGGPL